MCESVLYRYIWIHHFVYILLRCHCVASFNQSGFGTMSYKCTSRNSFAMVTQSCVHEDDTKSSKSQPRDFVRISGCMMQFQARVSLFERRLFVYCLNTYGTVMKTFVSM